MQQILQFALAVTLLIGGAAWLYAQLFVLRETMPLPMTAAIAATLGGACWLYGDFIFPLMRNGASRRVGRPERQRV